MADDQWEQLGVRPATVSEWEALGVDAFEAALAQGDGYGPSSARHALPRLRGVATGWRASGMLAPESLRWHRAGFAAREAARWLDQGIDLDAAAAAAGHRMVG